MCAQTARLQNLEAEAEERLAALKVLEKEHQALASKHAALEKLVQCRCAPAARAPRLRSDTPALGSVCSSFSRASAGR